MWKRFGNDKIIDKCAKCDKDDTKNTKVGHHFYRLGAIWHHVSIALTQSQVMFYAMDASTLTRKRSSFSHWVLFRHKFDLFECHESIIQRYSENCDVIPSELRRCEVTNFERRNASYADTL